MKFVDIAMRWLTIAIIAFHTINLIKHIERPIIKSITRSQIFSIFIMGLVIVWFLISIKNIIYYGDPYIRIF